MNEKNNFISSAGARGDSRLARVLTAIVMMFTLATTGAWAQRLYLEVDGTAATLKYSANEADYSGKPSFTGTTWQNASGFKASVKTITVDASCENFAGDKLQGLFTACSVLTSVTGLGTINTTNVTTMQQMFNNCSKLETVDLSGFNTANVTTMQQMFYGCSALETVDLSGFNTANVTDMKNMFYNCSSLETVDLSSFNTSSVTNMSYMFQGCTGLKSVNFSGLNTSSVTNMSYMFNGCSKLETVDLSGFNTANVTDMKNMFQGCTGLKSVNFSGLNTSGVTTMTYMFQGCTGLQTLDLSDLNTSSVTDMRNMFHNCTGLQTLDISSFNTGNVTKMGSMFNGCSQLTAIFVGADWIVASSANSMFTDCTNLPNWDGTSDGTKAYYGGDGKGYLTYKVDGPAGDTKYTVAMAAEAGEGWTIEPAEATTTGVDKDTKITATYSGTKRVKSVTAVVKAAEPAANIVDLSTLTENTELKDGDVLTGTLAANVKVSIADGATVTLDGVTINGVNNESYEWAGITCLGDATIILSGTNTVKGFYEEYPGIYVPQNKTLTIQGDGSLTASSNDYGAGIGGGYGIPCGNIVIAGGTITANGGSNSAGIGGGYSSGSCGAISITGGTVNATGGQYGAGIGGGRKSSCGTISITGGNINATGGNGGAGIGGGYQGSCGTVTITNGVTSVTATKGNIGDYSIGAGFNGTCGTVTIGGVEGAITTSPYIYQPSN